MRIWLIEDDQLTADCWRETVTDEGFEFRHFEVLMDAYFADGVPDAIIFDVGSIGLRQADQTYLSAFHQLRNKFPHTPIYLVSGLSYLPRMIREELPDDDLIYPITDLDAYSSIVDHIKARNPCS